MAGAGSPPPLRPGMRQTRQRQQVWEAVRGLGGHCTAEEITAELQRAQPGFPRSTVYRALEALATSGALHAVRLGDGPIHYEMATEDHQHAICQACQGVLHIEPGLVADLERHLEERHRFHPVRTDVVVVGICHECAVARGRRQHRRRVLDHVHFP
ncbi:MAG TPA: transcriptional repressor [Candidatus Dormibacteraeota bacterium]|nr:transcriptional repressor [Candidatus Dormibacteraeota bacterium]